MTFTLSHAGIKELKAHEGLRLKAYPDPGSKDGKPWTIGYGHTRTAHEGMVITEAEAEALLRQDVAWAERAVNNLVKVRLSQSQFDALVSFVYNVGQGAFQRSTLLRLLNKGQYDAVPAQLMRWVNNDGRQMRGLVVRRRKEAEMWRGLHVNAQAPAKSVEPAEPKDGKPAAKSTTIWSAIGGFLTTALTALSQMDWRVALPVVLIGAAFAFWIIRERMKKSKDYGI